MKRALLLTTTVAAAAGFSGCAEHDQDGVARREGSEPPTDAGGAPLSEPEAAPEPPPAISPSGSEASCGASPADIDTQPDAPLPAAPNPLEGASCDVDAAPCGGDVVGTWLVADCPLELTGQVDLRGFGLGCAGGRILSGYLEVSGTWTLDANGNFADATTTQGVQEFELAAACFSVGPPVTCERAGSTIGTQLGYDTLECVDDEREGCTCAGTFAQEGGLGTIALTPVEAGGYATSGNTLVATDGGNRTTYDYCSTDETLVLTFPNPGVAGTVEGSLVLQRAVGQSSFE
jgi:hypothetical protein